MKIIQHAILGLFLSLISTFAAQAQWTGASITNNQAHFQAIAYEGDTGLHVYGTGCIPRVGTMGMVNENFMGTGQGGDFLNTMVGVLRDVTLFNEGGERFFYSVGATATFSDTISVVVKRTEGGGLWQFDTVNTGHHRYYNALHFINAAEGFAVGGTSYGDGVLDRTLDSGATWLQDQVIEAEQISDVYFLDDDLGFFTTGGIRWLSCTTQELYPQGAIHRTLNGGISWALVHADANMGFTSIEFHTALIGCATRADGVILRTGDGGDTWTEATITTEPPFLLTGISVTPSGAWYASGFRESGNEGLILASIDGGMTWDQNTSTAGINYSRRIYDVSMYDDDFGMAAGNTRSLRTENGGGLPTTVGSIDHEEARISPNPASGHVMVHMPDQGDLHVQLTDMQGRIVLQHRTDSGMTALANLAPGVYVLIAEQKGRRYTQRLVVE